jgi:hypothetical protein
MKNYVSALLLFSIFLCVLFIIQPQETASSPLEKTGLATLYFAGVSGSRSFTSSVAADADVTVTLTMTLPDTNAYGVEEQYPLGFTVVDSNGADVNTISRHLYWMTQSFFTGTKTFKYTVKAPSYSVTSYFDGNYCFDDSGSAVTCNKFSTSPQSITVTATVNPCLGATDGTTCGTGKYCCASTCVNSVTCGTCQYAGCSGASAACLNSSSSTQCGTTTTCPTSFCGGVGNNTLNTYASTCNNLCSGSGSCTTCTCSAVQTACGNSKYCSSSTKTCTSCSVDTYNCDSNSLNGCEVNLRTDSSNCGACGVSCGSGNSCSNGVCTRSICATTTDRYCPSEIIVFIREWKSNQRSLSDLMQKIQVYKYCYKAC